MRSKYIQKIELGIISLLAILSLQAQMSKDAFLSMPEPMLLYLSSANRIDLIDLYDARLQSVVLNAFGDTISLDNLTKDYLLLRMKNASLQLIILPMENESKLYCIIHTICSPVCDSKIEFYSVCWKQLQTNLFITPVTKSYFINENPNCIPSDISFMQFIYNPKTLLLQQFYNTPKYLSIEDKQKIQPLIKNKVKVYKWNGAKFE